MKTSNDNDWFQFYVNSTNTEENLIKLENFVIRGKNDNVEANASNSSSSPEWEIKVYNDVREKPDYKKNLQEYDALITTWDKDASQEDMVINLKATRPQAKSGPGVYYLKVNIDGDSYRNLKLSGDNLSEVPLPTAYAGKDDTISEDRGKYVLDGSDSSGGDNYKWEEIQPWNNNSSITLSDKNSAKTSFDVPDVDPPQEKFTLELKVTNSTSERYDKDRVTITIEDTYDGGGSSDGGCYFAPGANLGWGWGLLLIVVAVLPFIRKRIVN